MQHSFNLQLELFQQFATALLTIASTCYAARLDNIYLPPGSAGSAGGAGLIHPPGHDAGVVVKNSGPISPLQLGNFGGQSGPGGPSRSGGLSGGYGGSSGFGPSGAYSGGESKRKGYILSRV